MLPEHCKTPAPLTNGEDIVHRLRILLFSYAFPPIHAPMSPVAAKLAVALAKLGCRVDVLCGSPVEPRLDTSLLPYVQHHVASTRSVSYNRWEYVLSRLRERVGVHRDAMHFLRRRTTNVIQSLLSNNYSAILTLSPFHSANLIMTSLKERHPNIRWIAQFSDPWARNPLEISASREAWSRYHEAQAVRAADRLVFTSAPARDLMLSDFDAAYRAKSAVVPHCWDPALYPKSTIGPKEKMTFRHVGTLMANRSPTTLFEAAQKLLQRRPDLAGKFVFHFVGDVPDSMMETPSALSLPNGTILKDPPVSYVASLQLMASADVLVLIEANIEFNLFVPSKLCDYVGADRPIMALAPPGASQQLLDRLKLAYWAPGDVAGISDALEKLIDGRFQAFRFRPDPDERAKLRSEVVAQHYLDLIDGVSSETVATAENFALETPNAAVAQVLSATSLSIAESEAAAALR